MEWLHSIVLALVETGRNEYKEAYNRIVTEFFTLNNSQNDSFASVPSSGLLRISYFLKRIHRKILKDFCGIQTFQTYWTLDTAIRCYSMLIDSLYCKDLVTNNTYKESINEDVSFAFNHLRKFDEKSN